MKTALSMFTLSGLMAIMMITEGLAQKKVDHDYFQQLLASGEHARVFREATQLRKDVYGKCAFLDYYIGKSLCRSGYIPKSTEWFEYILDHYNLKSEARAFIQSEITNCANPVQLSASSGNSSYVLPQAGVWGQSKSGPTYRCRDKSQLMSYEQIVGDEELESRLFAVSDKDRAVKKIQGIVGTDYTVQARDQYVLVTPSAMNINATDVSAVTNGLEKATRFFASYYGLRSPDKLITVYLASDGAALAKIGARVHSLKIPATLYGYSVLGDLSLLGIASPYQIGTLYHELFHLIVRTDAGDLPAWLDEGMASLYSTCSWEGDILKGDRTWRLEQLKPRYLDETGQKIPTLRDLLNEDWQQFNGGEETNLCRAAMNYALANHFLLFLQEKNKLQAVVNKYKTRPDPGDGLSPAAPDEVPLMEEILEMPMDSIQKEFDAWLKVELGEMTRSTEIAQRSTMRQTNDFHPNGDGSIGELMGKLQMAVAMIEKEKGKKYASLSRKYTRKVNSAVKEYRRLEEKYMKCLDEQTQQFPESKDVANPMQNELGHPGDQKLNELESKISRQLEVLRRLLAEMMAIKLPEHNRNELH